MDFASFVYRQLTFKPQPIPASIDLSGKTAIVTGANGGLGFEAARELVRHKLGRLIVAVRDIEKGEAAKAKLECKSACAIEVWELDMSDFASVSAFGKRAAALDRLDIAILNAGVQKTEYTRAKNGHEIQLQVNYLATALLSLLLQPVLLATTKQSTQPSRLTIVTSEMGMWTPFKQRSAPNLFQELDKKDGFGMDNYSVSKLLQVLWTKELASKIQSRELIINTVNPGYCSSSLQRDHDNFGFRMMRHICGWTAAQGGHCLADAAVVKQDETHGKYLSEQKLTR